MAAGDAYRAKAAELTAQARDELQRAQELEALASSYLRLAEMADRNTQIDLIFEPSFSSTGRAAATGAARSPQDG